MEAIDETLDAFLDGFIDAWERDILIYSILYWELDVVAADDDTPNEPFYESP